MNIAIIGSGNIGGTLAEKWAQKGHHIFIGLRDKNNFKGKHLLNLLNIQFVSISEAVQKSEVILMATPALVAAEVTQALGDTTNKIIIDTANIVMGRGPKDFNNVTDCILANTKTKDVVKCFNTTGYNNMQNPNYGNLNIDLFMAGDSVKGKEVSKQLALDAGFENCYDIGGNDKFSLMEQFAFFWINLAMFQGQGREIAFKLLKR